jgi:hypothetical protein
MTSDEHSEILDAIKQAVIIAQKTPHYPERRLRELVAPLWDEYIRSKRIDFEFILISRTRWGPVTYSAADKWIDHDGQALACNLFILHINLESDHSTLQCYQPIRWSGACGAPPSSASI